MRTKEIQLEFAEGFSPFDILRACWLFCHFSHHLVICCAKLLGQSLKAWATNKGLMQRCVEPGFYFGLLRHINPSFLRTMSFVSQDYVLRFSGLCPSFPRELQRFKIVTLTHRLPARLAWRPDPYQDWTRDATN